LNSVERVGRTVTVPPIAAPPLLRWAGSKRKLLPVLLRHSPDRYSRYIEPFVGSACLFFALAPRAAVLGDFNKDLIDFYSVVRQYPAVLAREIEGYPLDQQFYYELRSRVPSELTRIQAAARFLYLNRFCFNGVYRTNRQGRFNVPFGIKTGHLPTRADLKRASRLLQSAELVRGDFDLTIAKAKRNDFVYLDPPYSASRNRGEYGYGAFSSTDVDRLVAAATALDKKNVTFLISYQSDESTRRKFGPWFQANVNVRRHIAGFIGVRGNVTELLVSNRPFQENAA
jgi:DNA adenine methylase